MKLATRRRSPRKRNESVLYRSYIIYSICAAARLSGRFYGGKATGFDFRGVWEKKGYMKSRRVTRQRPHTHAHTFLGAIFLHSEENTRCQGGKQVASPGWDVAHFYVCVYIDTAIYVIWTNPERNTHFASLFSAWWIEEEVSACLSREKNKKTSSISMFSATLSSLFRAGKMLHERQILRSVGFEFVCISNICV